MITLYVTRHGITKWNEEHRLQGSQNSPLTGEGIQNARKLHEKYKDIPFSHCFSSPLPRAVHTSQLLIGDRGIPLFLDTELREIDLGAWEGLEIETVEKDFPEDFDKFWKYPEKFYPKSGENFYQVIERVTSFLEKVKNLPDEYIVLIVSHGIILQALVTICEGRDIKTLREGEWFSQTSTTHITYDKNAWNILKKNEKIS